MIGRDSRPRLAKGVRLREDRVRGGHNLLAPEHVLRVNSSSAAILALCDGSRGVEEIAEILASTHRGERERIAQDVRALLADLVARRLVET